MSKVEELKAKYSNISAAAFKKFSESDKTPTKKYLEFYLKTWNNRQENNCPVVITSLVRIVNKFDELLPYIENKDIYSKDYTDISLLKLVIARAEEIKEEKTFVRDENILVLDENDGYILLQPLTHRGSLKYGAKTKWCTAAKDEAQTFNRYTKNGLLVYLLDKTGTKTHQCNKVAFHIPYNRDIITDGFNIYNATDNEVSSDYLVTSGWDEDTLLKLTTMVNIFFRREKKLKKSKDFIQSFSETLSKLDFQTLTEHIELLEQNKNINYTSIVQQQINQLIENLNNTNYAGFTKT
jgi:hypothetical protein